MFKRRKRGFHLPPDDFIYGLKHPKQDGITGVAAGENEMNARKISSMIFLQLFNIIQSLSIHQKYQQQMHLILSQLTNLLFD